MKLSVWLVLVFILLLCSCCESANNRRSRTRRSNTKNLIDSNGKKIGLWRQLLYKYGYTSSDDLSPHEIDAAVTKLKILYRFDDSTTEEDILKFLQLPRCGNKDIHTNSERVRRYDLNPAWTKKSFKYTVETYSPDLSQEQQDSIAAQAFQLWKNAVDDLQFIPTQISSDADIKISFRVGSHSGCTQAFDGAGSILGHAYLPEDGRIHLDDDETFTDQSSLGTNLYALLAHEIGHALGLGHSFEPSAVMFAVYPGYNPPLTLHQDDIDGIRALYDTNWTPDPSCVDEDPSLCAMYKDQGYCIPEYADVMTEMCPQTCNLCG